MDKRRQGRPKRGENEVGLAFILESARNALRRQPFDVLSRKDLAAAVGVTPALISYYFPKGVDVADLVLSPVIFDHLQTLQQNIASASTPEEKMRKAFRDLIEAFALDKFVFEAYEAIAHTSPERNFTLVTEMHAGLSKLVSACQGGDIASLQATPILHGAIWGMCKAAAALRTPANCGPEPKSASQRADHAAGEVNEGHPA